MGFYVSLTCFPLLDITLAVMVAARARDCNHFPEQNRRNMQLGKERDGGRAKK